MPKYLIERDVPDAGTSLPSPGLLQSTTGRWRIVSIFGMPSSHAPSRGVSPAT